MTSTEGMSGCAPSHRTSASISASMDRDPGTCPVARSASRHSLCTGHQQRYPPAPDSDVLPLPAEPKRGSVVPRGPLLPSRARTEVCPRIHNGRPVGTVQSFYLLGFAENPIIRRVATEVNCNRASRGLRDDWALLRTNPQVQPIKAHSQAPEKHERSQIIAHPLTELDRKGEGTVASGEIIDHCAQQHVRQPTVHFPAAFLAPREGKTHFGNFLSGNGGSDSTAPVPASGNRHTATRSLPALEYTAHTLPHPPSLLAKFVVRPRQARLRLRVNTGHYPDFLRPLRLPKPIRLC